MAHCVACSVSRRQGHIALNVMNGYLNATKRGADATLKGDTWTAVIDGGDTYEAPLAYIQGG